MGHDMVGLTLNYGQVLEPVLNTRDDTAITNSELDQFLRFRAQEGISLEALVVQGVGTSGLVCYASLEYLALNPNKARIKASPGSGCCGGLWGRQCPCIMSMCLLCQVVTSACAQQAGLCGAASEEHVCWGPDGELPGQWDAGAACLAGATARWVSLSFEKQHTLLSARGQGCLGRARTCYF